MLCRGTSYYNVEKYIELHVNIKRVYRALLIYNTVQGTFRMAVTWKTIHCFLFAAYIAYWNITVSQSRFNCTRTIILLHALLVNNKIYVGGNETLWISSWVKITECRKFSKWFMSFGRLLLFLLKGTMDVFSIPVIWTESLSFFLNSIIAYKWKNYRKFRCTDPSCRMMKYDSGWFLLISNSSKLVLPRVWLCFTETRSIMLIQTKTWQILSLFYRTSKNKKN